jgi:steroid delta-isomerase-like uncharacterized protein
LTHDECYRDTTPAIASELAKTVITALCYRLHAVGEEGDAGKHSRSDFATPGVAMAARNAPLDDRSPRVAIVEEHVRHENEHNLEGVIQTFGEYARYDDEPWNQHYEGREQVREFYEQLMAALPDLSIEIVRRHIAAETIVLEVIIRGTQLGPWRGLPATGRRVEVPICGVYTFGADDRLAGERIYYDRAMVLRQLGVFHEPQTALGGITIMLTHPLTILQALGKRLRRN